MSFKTLYSEARSAISTSVLALPAGLAYGAIVFTPLGDEFTPLGVLSGLLAIVFSNAGAWALGNRFVINETFLQSALMMSGVVAILIGNLPQSDNMGVLLLGCTFFVVSLSGFFQIIFGILRLGSLAKYIPTPVISGLLNGTAIIVLSSTLGGLLGVDYKVTYYNFTDALDDAKFYTCAVAAVSIVAIYFAPIVTRYVPIPFFGILTGSAFYFALDYLGLGAELGKTIAAIQISVNPIDSFNIFIDILFSDKVNILMQLLPLALAIAVVNTLRSFLATVAVDEVLFQRSGSNKEAIAQGMGNILCGLFGAIPAAGNAGRSVGFYRGGARSRLAKLIFIIISFGMCYLLSISDVKLPEVIIDATIFVFALRSFDAWGIDILKRIARESGNRRKLLGDAVVMLIVMVILIIFGIFPAVGLGIALSLFLFVYRMSKNNIRRTYKADSVHSNVHRNDKEFFGLEEHGGKILVMELHGSLFFGTTDKLAGEVDALLKQEYETIILDFYHVDDVDATGAKILVQLEGMAYSKNKELLMSSLPDHSKLYVYLNSIGAVTAIGRSNFFDSIDLALAHAEDHLLDVVLGTERHNHELSITDIGLLNQMNSIERYYLEPFLERVEYKPGETIFAQFDPPDYVFFVAKGRVHLDYFGGGLVKPKRIGTLTAGNLFGEMSIVDRRPRAATVVADEHHGAVCYRLRPEDLEQIQDKAPHISTKLLTGLAVELSKRLRISNRIANELKAR